MYKELTPGDIRNTRSSLNQLVDIPQETISSSLNRQDHLNFVTASVNSLTSSLFVTVFDQDRSLQTSNAVFDITTGIYLSASDLQTAKSGDSSDGLVLFPSNLTMNREKVSIYKEFASYLLGSPDYFFTAPYTSPGTSYSAPSGGFHSTSTRRIDYALFVAFKRLFVRDSVKRETVAFKIFSTAALDGKFGDTKQSSILNGFTGSNIYRVTPSGSTVVADTASATSLLIAPDGGNVGNIYSTTNSSYAVGTMFYDKGIAVFDMEKIFANQHISGSVRSVLANGGAHTDVPNGYYPIGDVDTTNFSLVNPNATFFPDFMISGSIQDIVDHVCSTRFSSSNATAITFQNQTDVNSMLVFCRANSDEFNYSSNPTYVDTDGRLVVIEPGQEGIQQSFSFITTVGLHNEIGQLLAVAKLSRPILKDAENDLVIRARLDW